jgi:hypothetical protein
MMKRYTLIFSLLVVLIAIYVASANSDFFHSSKETPVAAALADKITASLKKLPEEGAYLNHIELIEGIRANDGEISSVGEIKILVNLDWQSLPNHPEQRKALDNSAARIISAVFSDYNEITKLRVIVKTPKSKGNYKTEAKVFSFTRATWELSRNNTRYDLNTPAGAANLLALGDYVVLTAQGWTRGY